MKKRTFHCYSDPGHGWLKVKIDFLKKIGIADKITTYSYVRKDCAYLEEDYDASNFLCKLKEIGIEYVLKHHIADKSSKIRSYDYYDPAKIS